jgi:hypothetical protein
MNEELPLLNLSGFHLRQPEGKPYRVFDPAEDGEYERLAEFLHVNEIEDLALKEGYEVIERDGLDPFAEPLDWSRIYAAAFEDENGNKFTTTTGESVYVFFHVLLKGELYTKIWIAFLCSPEGYEALEQDQSPYDEKCRQWLEIGHKLPPAGGLN